LVHSRSGIAIAYAGAALIGVAGILLSVVVFLQTAHTFGSQAGRPPAIATPRTLPSTGPLTPGGQRAAPPKPAGTTGEVQASRLYPRGEPPGDIEDEPSPGPSPPGTVAGMQLPVPARAPAPLPVVSPQIH
jgi:hypothetical protein